VISDWMNEFEEGDGSFRDLMFTPMHWTCAYVNLSNSLSISIRASYSCAVEVG